MKEDTRSEKGQNDYTIILRELKQFKPSLRVANSAPPVVMRGNFINTVFATGYHGLDIIIGTECKKTITDYMFLKEDSDGTKAKTKEKDPATGRPFEKYGHTSDANDYFICYAFAAEFTAYQRGDKKVKVTTGKNTSKNNY
jgi:hypothetical protein